MTNNRYIVLFILVLSLLYVSVLLAIHRRHLDCFIQIVVENSQLALAREALTPPSQISQVGPQFLALNFKHTPF